MLWFLVYQCCSVTCCWKLTVFLCWMFWCSVLCKWCVYIVCLSMFLESVQHIGQLIVFNRALEINCLALPMITLKCPTKVCRQNISPRTVSHDSVPKAGIHFRKQWPHLLFCRLMQAIYYIWKWWLLLLFLVIFSASLSGSDDFVLFDSLVGK